MKNSISTTISVCSLIISITAGIFTYKQQQHIEILQQQLLETVELELEHAKTTQELQKIVWTVAKNSSLEVQLNKMIESTKNEIQQDSKKLFESTKDKIKEHGQELFDSTREMWEKFSSPASE